MAAQFERTSKNSHRYDNTFKCQQTRVTGYIFRSETVQLRILRQGFHEKRLSKAARAYSHGSETFRVS